MATLTILLLIILSEQYCCLLYFPGARASMALRVQITVVDVYGQRHVLRALTGHTLVDVLQEHSELLGSEEVTESPEGRGVVECVVSVPNEFLEQIPQTKDYLQQLRQITPSVTSNCRLGSKIILTKEMNDMQVAMHEVYPWRTI
ncbi:hypothetical protein WJX82_007593 [Trebouxia sp. C0006]